jgi:hypothetical protein
MNGPLRGACLNFRNRAGLAILVEGDKRLFFPKRPDSSGDCC